MRRLLFIALALLIITSAGIAGSAYAAPGGPGKGVGGQVTAIEGATIKVSNPKGAASIVTTASTTFKVNGADGTLASVTVGMFVHADGTKDASGTFTATRVVASTTQPTPPARKPHPRR